MTVLIDNMICGLCKGKKVILNEATGKMDICPKCQGTGKLKNDQELDENKNKKNRLLLEQI